MLVLIICRYNSWANKQRFEWSWKMDSSFTLCIYSLASPKEYQLNYPGINGIDWMTSTGAFFRKWKKSASRTACESFSQAPSVFTLLCRFHLFTLLSPGSLQLRLFEAKVIESSTLINTFQVFGVIQCLGFYKEMPIDLILKLGVSIASYL